MNGERDGPFELRLERDDESILLMTGNMVKGVLNGFGEIYDPDKGKIFEGTWENGVRCGTCIEFDYNSVSFQGAYHNDKRNGYGWEYHDNELQREGEWFNGEYQEAFVLTMQENFVNSGLGMILSHNKDDILITTVGWKDGKANGDGWTYSKKEKRIIQKRLYLHGDEIDRSLIHTSPSIGDITFTDGSTWHGDIENGVAMGNGELIDSNKQVMYSGQMFYNMRFGQGISYKNGKKEYEGDWSCNKRMGDGKEYLPDGTISKEGVWIADRFCEPTFDIVNEPPIILSHYLIRTFHIGDNLLNDIVSINFSLFSLLEDLAIGKNSLKELEEMEINSLNRLRKVSIGSDSLTLCIKWQSPSTLPPAYRQQQYQGKTISMNESRIKSEMKKLSFMNCNALESITLGDNTCSDFYSILFESWSE